MTVDPLAAILEPFRAPWRALAACDNPDLMYDPRREHEAKTICRHCPVRTECLAEALDRGEPDGIWGGLNPTQRTELETSRPADIPRLMQKFAQADRSRTQRTS